MASRADWKKRVAEWKRSGLTAGVFADQRGLNPRTLLWWSSTLRRPAARVADRAAEVGFARVVTVDHGAPAPAPSVEPAALEIVLTSGRVVRVRRGFDVAVLREVLSALEAS
jgi:transposase